MKYDLDKYIDTMGFTYVDKVTGYRGVAESVSFDLYGCVQIALRPAVVNDPKEGHKIPDGRWFDATRLSKDSSVSRVMEVPTFIRVETPPEGRVAPGPADKDSIR